MYKEFVDARRRALHLQNAPQVLFRSEPPLELEGVPGLKNAAENDTSYVTFGNSLLFLTLQIESPTHNERN